MKFSILNLALLVVSVTGQGNSVNKPGHNDNIPGNSGNTPAANKGKPNGGGFGGKY
jgi:hypothetical protein